MPASNRKKSSLLINPSFQWSLIGYTAGLSALIFVSLFGLMEYALRQFIKNGQDAGFPADHIYFQFIHLQESVIHRALLVMALIVGALLISWGLVISHKIAGPIYRMQSEFKNMAAQKPMHLKTIQFRKGDYFPELAEAYNELVKAHSDNKS